MPLPIVDVPISPDAIVRCPERQFAARRAQKACVACPHFAGVGQMATSGPWHVRYAIRCRGVVERRTEVLPEVLEE